MDEIISDFIAETGAGLDQIETDLARLCADETAADAMNRALRVLHTIKGACGFLRLPRIEALTHACEGALERVRDGRGAPDAIALVEHGATQIRVILADLAGDGVEPKGDDTLLLDALGHAPNALDWAVELTRARDRLLALAGGALSAPFAKLNAIALEGAAVLDLAARAPIESAWKTLPLLARDLSESLGKQITLELVGGDTEVERAALGPLKDALSHLIRNCADHGLETPEERRACAKPAKGVIRIAATHEDDSIVIMVGDDGRGLNTARIRHRAITRGLVFAAAAARMSAAEIHPFIFAPGFSTADKPTRHSGRGIGLDAVRADIESLGGRVTLSSEPGKGTIFTLTIPAHLPHTQAAPAQENSTALPASDARVA